MTVQSTTIPKVEVFQVEIQKLKKYERNVKFHTERQINTISELIKLVGFKDPIVIDENHVILAGHGRLEHVTIVLFGITLTTWLA